MGLVAMSGGPVEEIRLGDKTFKLKRAELGSVIARAMQQIISERPDPIAALASVIHTIPAREKDAAWKAAFWAHRERSNVNLVDLQDWIMQPTGMSWLIWYMIEDSRDLNATQEHPEGTKGIQGQNQLLGIVSKMPANDQIEIGNKIAILLGIEDIKN